MVKFYIPQWLYEQAIKEGIPIPEGCEVVKELPRQKSLPEFKFNIDKAIVPTRIKGKRAQWKLETRGRLTGGKV